MGMSMRVAVVSDIHANLTAVDAVIADVRKDPFKTTSLSVPKRSDTAMSLQVLALLVVHVRIRHVVMAFFLKVHRDR
jgi:hypothetical protein